MSILKWAPSTQLSFAAAGSGEEVLVPCVSIYLSAALPSAPSHLSLHGGNSISRCTLRKQGSEVVSDPCGSEH